MVGVEVYGSLGATLVILTERRGRPFEKVQSQEVGSWTCRTPRIRAKNAVCFRFYFPFSRTSFCLLLLIFFSFNFLCLLMLAHKELGCIMASSYTGVMMLSHLFLDSIALSVPSLPLASPFPQPQLRLCPYRNSLPPLLPTSLNVPFSASMIFF